MTKTWLLTNKTSALVLQFLESLKIRLGDTIEESIAVVQFLEQKRTNNMVASVIINESAKPVYVANLPVNRSRELSYVIRHCHVSVKGNAQITDRIRLLDFSITNYKAEVLDLGMMVW